MEAFLAMLIFTMVVAQDLGYHRLVGIPVAERIYKVETTSSPIEEIVELPTSLDSYLVGLVISVDESFSICGSSLLSNTRALTAAHCWWDGWQQAQQFTLVFGSEYLFVGGTRIVSKSVVMHEQWDPMSLLNNLAMIMFHHVPYSKYVQPITLPVQLQGMQLIGSMAIASGYGKAMPDSAGFAPSLTQTNVVIGVVPIDHCINSMYDLMQRTVCTRNKGRVCISHAGGPLATNYDDERFLIGVASFGDYNCTHDKDAVAGFVRVTFYLQWIYAKLQGGTVTP